jgi:endonuclease III related protein
MGRMLMAIYRALHAHYGPQRWWPTHTGSPWEVMMGAVLTQHTTWANVAAALSNMLSVHGTRSLSIPQAVLSLPDDELAALLRPTGHYNTKPRRLKNLARFVVEEGGTAALAASRENTQSLRSRLLAISGIGPETADAILLYALGRPVFVADAYARRLASRWGLLPPTASYDAIQALFMNNLPHDASLFNEYHALIVAHGKTICRPRPQCPVCPLNRPLPLAPANDQPEVWSCPRLHTEFSA